MNETEATQQAKKLLNNPTAVAFNDDASPLFPYLIGINTPTGELGVIASGRSYAEALDKAKLWLAMQKRPVAQNN